MPEINAAASFLNTLNTCHPAIKFTMETESDNQLPFIGMCLIRTSNQIKTQVYRKSTNTGLLLHNQSHVDSRYKKAIIRTIPARADRLSLSKEMFTEECQKLKSIFSELKYPETFTDSIIRKFIASKLSDQQHNRENRVRVVLPFKDQQAADTVKKQLEELSSVISQMNRCL